MIRPTCFGTMTLDYRCIFFPLLFLFSFLSFLSFPENPQNWFGLNLKGLKPQPEKLVADGLPFHRKSQKR